MDTEKNTPTESAEELEAEQKHLAGVKEDDIRKEIISAYGFDAETDKERIDKALAREMGHHKALSQTIGQKVKYRTEYQKLKDAPPKDAPTAKADDADLDTRLAAALEKRDLEDMEFPDEIKKVVAQVAKINGISVKKALADPYVASKVDTWRKQQDADGAAISRNHKSGGTAKDEDPLSPPDVDLNTKEGREAYDKWKAGMIKKGY
jgi:hypothetical protein